MAAGLRSIARTSRISRTTVHNELLSVSKRRESCGSVRFYQPGLMGLFVALRSPENPCLGRTPHLCCSYTQIRLAQVEAETPPGRPVGRVSQHHEDRPVGERDAEMVPPLGRHVLWDGAH